MVASLTDIEDGIEISSLTATGEHSPHATLEGSNLTSHRIIGRILQTSIEIALFLQVEKVGHLFRVVILERGTLIDR